jgi:hypothetical protein
VRLDVLDEIKQGTETARVRAERKQHSTIIAVTILVATNKPRPLIPKLSYCHVTHKTRTLHDLHISLDSYVIIATKLLAE